MALETKSNLNKETIVGLQELIRINIDSVKGFNEVANETKDKTIAVIFLEIGKERANHGTELQSFVAKNSDQPVQTGSLLGTMHRTWINLRALINGNDSYLMLVEAERGEDAIKTAYENVLRATAGSAMNDVLTRQYATVKSGHDRIRGLRDQLAPM